MTSKKIKADLILIHAPSIYDFRNKDDTLLGSMAESDSVNVTPVFEMYPLGFLALKSYLAQQGLKVEIINLASLMLHYPSLDVEKLLGRLESPIFGIDLHWVIHCHGSLEVASLLKKTSPESLVTFGGISSTYYSQELIRYPQVDVVVRGYDTLVPTKELVETVKNGKRDLSKIPNLVYKDGSGEIRDNGFSYTPQVLNDVFMDWSFFFPEEVSLLNMPSLMVLPNSGCAHDCGWCGGSRFAYRNIMGLKKKTVVYRDNDQIDREIATVPKLQIPASIYSLQAYSESQERLIQYIDAVEKSGCIRSVALEQFRLTPPKLMKRLAEKTDVYINLSPESHDLEVSKLSGRGTFSMEQMEDWIEEAFDCGIKGVYVWFFIGMPKQSYASVMETVDYCARLMEKFRKRRVVPTVTPMAPFLDPGCRFFEEPDKHGYRVFFKGLQAHREALVQTRWQDRLNYETRWLPRDQFLDCAYTALRKMVEHKLNHGRLDAESARVVDGRMTRTLELISAVEQARAKDNNKLPQSLRDEILSYNRDVVSYSSDAIVSARRPIVGRWYDDYTVPPDIIADCCVEQ